MVHQLESDAKHVAGVVLAIRVRGNQSGEIWKSAKEMIYSSLERRPFSKIYRVMKHMNGLDLIDLDLLDLAETFRVFSAASVIDDNDWARVRLRQRPHKFNKRFFRTVSRNEDRELLANLPCASFGPSGR